ncbi:MAG: hypothetical protein UW96_C0020G0009 [Candidatus Collierbacteria bacterium GW2011_GWA1_45_15]|nr:MAG: hypothetical protein UW96_C0020G0009 [Candidatus Collierbacteria bacterium GW2011_GWA1_45_15]
MTEAKQKIYTLLKQRTWFKATDEAIQKEILALPDDCDGFLENLASRPDEIGELDVLKMTKLGYGHFLLLPVFEVRSNITNQIFTYEYVSWKTGNHPGASGIIFLETEGKISHFLVSKIHKFSVDKDIYESIGGLYFHFLENKPQNLPKKIEQEIRFHLGVDHLEFKKVINLGLAHPDLGMTNNASDLFAAVIDISNLPNLTTKADFRSTHKPIGFELKVIHISEFMDYLNIIDDNYFLSAAARVLASKEIDLEL